VDGARAADVAGAQLRAFRERSPDGRFDVGCLYVGVNDVRSLDWDPAAYARDVETVVAALRERCDRVLVATIPLDLGRPRAGAKVEEANAIVEATGALVLDLRDFGARNHVMVDHVHPTAFGQVAIAERALDVLAADGMRVRVRPSTLIAPAERTRWRTLRGDWTYAYRHLKTSARAWAAERRAARAATGRTDNRPR
jgi:hypothetical protein